VKVARVSGPSLSLVVQLVVSLKMVLLINLESILLSALKKLNPE
jgi:hypothetical protein